MIKLGFSGQIGKQFMKISKDSVFPFFTIQIDRNLITEADSGTFNLEIEASDSSGTGKF